jgi:hypothetical protein
LWGSHALTNSIEFRHAKDVKTLEFRAGMGRNDIDESNDLFKYEKVACQG